MNDDIREKKIQLLNMVEAGEMTEAEARDLSGRLEAKGSAVFTKERPVINEQHPELSNWDRALFKNVSLNEQQGLDELQRRAPDLRFSFKNGEIVVRKPDEEDWRKIEPNNMWFNYSGQGGLGEFGKDVGDILYDVPAAALETTATVAGGIGGGLATAPSGGWGAIPGAMGAGAAAGAATEAGRQGLGNLTGFAQGYDTGQIGTSAAFGGLAPAFFGSGATAKGILKSMTKKGLVSEMGEEAAEKMAKKIANAQRSLITRGVGKAAMWGTNRLGAWASGYQPETLKKLRQRMAEGLMDTNPVEIARGFRNDLLKSRAKKKEILTKAYGESLEALDVAVDTGKVEQPLLDLLTEYEKRAEKAVPGFQQKLKETGQATQLLDASGQPLKEAEDLIQANAERLNQIDVQNYLHLKESIEPYLRKGDTLEGRDIVQYIDNINDLTNIRKNVDVKKKAKVDQDLERVAREVAGEIDKGLDRTMIGEGFKNIKDQYAEFFADGKIIDKYLKDDKAAESTLRNLNSQAEFVRRDDIERLAQNYDIPVEDYANDMYLMNQFLNPASSGKYLGGTSPMQRSVPMAFGLGALGYASGQKMGVSPFLSAQAGMALGFMSGSPAAIKNYTRAGNLFRSGVNQTRRLQPLPQAGANVWQQMTQQRQGRE